MINQLSITSYSGSDIRSRRHRSKALPFPLLPFLGPPLLSSDKGIIASRTATECHIISHYSCQRRTQTDTQCAAFFPHNLHPSCNCLCLSAGRIFFDWPFFRRLYIVKRKRHYPVPIAYLVLQQLCSTSLVNDSTHTMLL